MNLHGNTATEFVREWQSGESPLYRSMANPARGDGADPVRCREQVTFETIFNVLPTAAVFTSTHGEIRVVNRAFTTLFGAPPQEVIGKPIAPFCADTADAIASGRLQPHGHSGAIAKPFDVRYRTNDRGTFIGETVITAVKDGGVACSAGCA